MLAFNYLRIQFLLQKRCCVQCYILNRNIRAHYNTLPFGRRKSVQSISLPFQRRYSVHSLSLPKIGITNVYEATLLQRLCVQSSPLNRSYSVHCHPLVYLPSPFNNTYDSDRLSGLYNRICKPQHLICFKQWTGDMVMSIINSAIGLKCSIKDSHGHRMDLLSGHKVMILQEMNQPVLNMAVSKAATLLGACDVTITDSLVWDQDYAGRLFSYMADAIFVATSTHMCVQRFANQSCVPVLCMISRTHATIQALATIMAIVEQYGTMQCVNVSYLGPPHQSLNSFLLLCPMLGANFKYKCNCDIAPVTPLLYKAAQDMCESSHTKIEPCKSKEEVLCDSCVIISGPTTPKKEKIKFFTISKQDIMKNTNCNWIYIHTCPRGAEVDDELFYHVRSRTYHTFQNMHFIAAALMAFTIKGTLF